MSQSHEIPVEVAPKRRRTRKRWWVILFLIIVLGSGYFISHKRPETNSTGTMFPVTRGPLEVTVLAGGSVEAFDSQVVSSEVNGETKILSIVEDGYTVTPEDVQNKKLLVELDSKELEDRKLTQDLEYENAQADNIQAKKEYEMQINQNLSDITSAALAAKFAYMDFEKYMGISAAKEILSQIDLDRDDLNEIVNRVEKAVTAFNEAKPVTSSAIPEPEAKPAHGKKDGKKEAESDKTDKPDKADKKGPKSSVAEDTQKDDKSEPIKEKQGTDASVPKDKVDEKKKDEAEPAAPPEISKPKLSAIPTVELPEIKNHDEINWTKYAKVEALGDGEARQMLRKLESSANLADGTMKLSETQFDGTKRLASKDFVTKNELETEKLKVEGNKISKESADTEQKLFLDYTFPKEAEKRLSDYEESVRRLLRTAQQAESKLAQVRARRNSAEARYSVQSRHQTELTEQITKCKIYAKVPGLVAYAGQDDWRGMSRIEVGASVRRQQQIITIPDMSQMVVKIKIPEASIRSVVKGQKARISIDAFPDKSLTGEVLKVGVLPDTQNRWMNPDVKVYETTIKIDGTQDWLRPGMSAQVEVVIKRLPDVLYVPIQAVVPKDGKRVVYVNRLAGKEMRPVEIGDFNDQFIEVKTGLSEGEQVLLRAPLSPDSAEKKKDGRKDEDDGSNKEKRNRDDSAKSDAAGKTENAKTDPAKSEGAKPDAAKTETVKKEPVKEETKKDSESAIKPAAGKEDDKNGKAGKDGASSG